MAFGEKDEKTDDGRAGLASTESPTWPSMESIESLSPIKESTPVTSLIHDSGLSESSPSLFHDDVRDDEDDDDEGSESATEEQVTSTLLFSYVTFYKSFAGEFLLGYSVSAL